MKRFVLIGLLLILVAGFGFGQTSDQPEVVIKTVPIVRIYSHTYGYQVFYQRASLDIASFYAPTEWFSSAAGIGQIVYGEGAEYPYFTAIWMDGELKTIRLYVQRNTGHITWGLLRGDNITPETFQVAPDFKF